MISVARFMIGRLPQLERFQEKPLVYTLSHYKLHTDEYEHILECRFIHFDPYLVNKISKKTYI